MWCHGRTRTRFRIERSGVMRDARQDLASHPTRDQGRLATRTRLLNRLEERDYGRFHVHLARSAVS